MRGVLGSIGSRVAQGVGGVAKNVGGAIFNADMKAALTATSDDESDVELQLQRLSDALMPEYRREAIGQLKDLLVDNPKAQLAVGNMGIPVLVSVLQDDRDDLELVRGALECLVCAMTTYQTAPGSSSAAGAAHAATSAVGGNQGQESQAGAINAELFARKPEHVQLLLSLLEDEPVGINDFYVRYHTAQLLTVLLQACAYKLQDAILSAPMGVVRLCELLGEREVIRNEALQLLVALTRANEEVQKIAAFEGAFDRVFTTVREEGGADGAVVVQDCLELLNNLLRNNQANQRLFREMGFVSQLVHVLAAAVPPAAAGTADGVAGAAAAALSAAAANAAAASGLQVAGRGPVQVSRQKAAILLCALESVMLLVTPGPNSSSSLAGAGPSAGGSTTGGAAGPTSPGAGLQSSNSSAKTEAAAMHAALLQAGVVEALLPLCLTHGGVSSAAVRVQALRAMGDIISGHAASRDKLAGSSILAPNPAASNSSTSAGGPNGLLPPPSFPQPAAALLARPGTPQAAPFVEVPALQALLRLALHSLEPAERSAADHVLRAYCLDNPDGQLALVCSITPAAGGAGVDAAYAGLPNGFGQPAASPAAAPSFGSELAAALVGGSGGVGALQVSCRAALLLQHLLESNPTAKQRLLNLPLEMPAAPSAPPELLLPKCMKHVMAALRVGGREGQSAATLLLRLLVVWLHGCAPAAQALLSVASHLPLLVDLVLGRHPESCAEVSGLSALLLGECLIYSTGSTSNQPHTATPPNSHASGSSLVLDVLLSRVGLSQYLSRLDELMACPSFVAASQPAKLPKPVTRSSAAAATAGDAEEEGDGQGGAAPAPLPARASAHAGGGEGGSQPLFDYAFTQLTREVSEAVKQAVMAAFAKPGSSAGAAPPSMGTPEQVVASLPGSTETAKLVAAVDVLRRLEAEVSELRSRNRALAEDLFKVAGGGAPTSAISQQHLQQGGPAGAGGPHHSQSQPSPAAGPAAAAAAAPSPAELEARMAAELRASRAEMELAALKQQCEMLSVRLQQADKDAAAAREAAAQAHLVATKHEIDLQDLSTAYNSLEAHAFQLESQVRELSAKVAASASQQQPAAGPGGVPEQQVLARIQAAVAAALEAERKARQSAAGGGGGGISEEEVARQLEEARAEATAEADEQMTDLLVCLGQEEQKVAVLRERLEGYGVDVDALLATIQPEEEEGVDEGEGQAGGQDDELR